MFQTAVNPAVFKSSCYKQQRAAQPAPVSTAATRRSIVSNGTRSYVTVQGKPSSSKAPLAIAGLLLVAGTAWWGLGRDDRERAQAKEKLDKKVEETKEHFGHVKDKVVDAASSVAGSTAAGATGATGGSALNKNEFREFKLEKVIPYNHNTSRFVFKLPEGTDSGLTVASALVVKSVDPKAAVTKEGKPAIRPYTPTTAPNEVGKLELLVKKYPGGAMTEHIHSLKEGDGLLFKGPIPKFPWKANQFEHVAMIAGGSGITPMWQVMQKIDSDPNDKTKVTLLFSNVTEQDILLRKEFEEMQRRKPDQFNIKFTLDKPPSGWNGPSGYVDNRLLAQNLPAPALGERIKIFVCGPPGQMDAISGNKKSPSDQGELKGLLADLGYTENQVYKF